METTVRTYSVIDYIAVRSVYPAIHMCNKSCGLCLPLNGGSMLFGMSDPAASSSSDKIGFPRLGAIQHHGRVLVVFIRWDIFRKKYDTERISLHNSAPETSCHSCSVDFFTRDLLRSIYVCPRVCMRYIRSICSTIRSVPSSSRRLGLSLSA